ncbi:CRISPR-associated endoribonuclease Cas6 [Meiothermus luteus]|jgi:CRISPR-associated endoribonuclease Cas6|uniref:CRISPR-associated endoribonuclease Cas6 n=1 Tax=Meiothermus luteus TaxID=2026184 RepID=A0A399EUG5_9DEIN|nr:CRISPR-associated endoribonuclease Cas6 [Meiothermus luteus]RIH88257.1 CRISPR-associated endoribonuclease Cas6 [Meiothermus luteus]
MPHAVVLELIGEKTPLYPAKYAHGLFFALLSRMDPELAQRLHEAPRKPFTLAPLIGRNRALFLRFTTLDDGLFAPFLRVLLEAAPEGLPLGDTPYRLMRVLATPEGHSMAGTCAWAELKKAPRRREATLFFQSPTVFATSKPGGRTRYTPLPDPRLIVGSLLDKWQAHSPYPYPPREEAALRILFELDLELAGFHSLRFHRVQAGKSFFPGFTGEVTLKLHSESLEAQEALGRLSALAFYSGVGAKTPYGMGVARVQPSPRPKARSSHSPASPPSHGFRTALT